MKHVSKKIFLVGVIASTLAVNGLNILADDVNIPPEKPGNNENGGTPPDGEPPEGKPDDGNGMGGGPGGANTQTYDYSGTLSGIIVADGNETNNEESSYSTETADQNVALSQNDGTLTLDGVTLNKSGDDDNGDNCNFYGINSIALTVGENSKTIISNSLLNSDSSGSNAIFSTDNGTAYINSTTITTSKDNSRGLDATYGGTIIANALNITTQGDHSASIATDRGGGSISVTNSSLNTNGSGSPLLYSTGDIEVDNVTGTANGSQIAGMEGLNTILIYNSTLESTITDKTASDPIANGIIIYQSTSGDAETTTGSTAEFDAYNSTLTSSIQSGSMFYLTNTSANIVLQDTTLSFDSSKANLLTIEGNDSNNWGTAGSNGANVSFTGLNETLNGNISVDTISSLDMYLLDGTTYTGSTSITTNSVNTKTTESPITMNISSDSKWIVTGDSTITNLNIEDGGQILDEDGNTVSIIVDGKTVVSGNSSYSITVNESYSTSFTTNETNALSTSYIDRSDFDSTFNLSTTFGSNNPENNLSETSESTFVIEDDETNNNNSMIIASIVCAIVICGVVLVLVTKKNKKK